MAVSYPAILVAILAGGGAIFFWLRSLRLKRAEFIRTYQLPPGLLVRLEEAHPNLTRKDTALVSRALRQFFLAYLMSDRNYVAMPSQIVDDLWHEFILYTKHYQSFCDRAFGAFLHHAPAAVLEPHQRGNNEGLRRVWWYACKYENIDPYNPTRPPLLFAIDAKLNIPNGFHYLTDCENRRDGQLPDGRNMTRYCAADFAKNSIDGTLAGFGARRGTGIGGCGAGGVGQYGGGCGGGCSGRGGCGGGGGCGGS